MNCGHFLPVLSGFLVTHSFHSEPLNSKIQMCPHSEIQKHAHKNQMESTASEEV